MQAGGISLHAVDVISGRAALGMRVWIECLDPALGLLAEGVLGADGMLDHPIKHGAGMPVQPATYLASFAIREFYAGKGIASPFLDVLPFRFVIETPADHIHLPLKFSPWGLALFRGV